MNAARGRSRPGPRRRWGIAVALGIAAAILLVTLFVVWYVVRPNGITPSRPPNGAGPSPSGVEIEGYDLMISYRTTDVNDTHYLDSPECGSCPVTLTPGTEWTVELTLTNQDAVTPHNLTGVQFPAPFRLLALSPGIPLRLPPGDPVTLDATLLLPGTAGAYFLTGTLEAS